MKKLTAIILTIAMLFSIGSISAFAGYECPVTEDSVASDFETLKANIKYHTDFIGMLVESIAEKAVSVESAEDILSILQDARECFRCVKYIFASVFLYAKDIIL